MAKVVMTVDEMRKNVPSTITRDMIKFMHERVPHYLFKYSAGKKKLCYCTCCKKDFEISVTMQHKKKYGCPECGHMCIAIDSGRSRKYLEDQSYFTFFKRANRRTDAICALGVFIRRQWDGDYRKVSEFTGELNSMYLFEHGKGSTRFTSRLSYGSDGWNYRMEPVKEIGLPRQLFLQYKEIDLFCDIESLKAAVMGTPFERYQWQQYNNQHFLRFLDAAAKWPCVEYLDRLGYTELISDYTSSGSSTKGVVNWHGKTMEKVLRLDKQTIKLARKQKVALGCATLYLLQKLQKRGERLEPLQAEEIANAYGIWAIDEFLKLHRYGKVTKIDSYCKKQKAHEEYKKLSLTSVLSDWRDYLGFCAFLGMNMADEAVAFPSHLKAAHDRRMHEKWDKEKQQRATADKKAQRMQKMSFKKRHKQYQNMYGFAQAGLTMRPAASPAELNAESDALHHCVRQYAQRYADGNTVICFIRKDTEPDTPYYTAEFRPGGYEVMQCRGNHNCAKTPEIDAFLAAFVASKQRKERQSA